MNERPRSLWRNRDFLLLWSGQVVSLLGTNISGLALPLLVLALTRSPAQAGFITGVQLAPYLIFSLPTGALIDRWDRKVVMIRCEIVRWLALGSVPLAFVVGHLSLGQLYIVAFVEGTAYVFFSLAQLSALPRVVHATHLPQAYALSEMTESSGSLIGPALGGFIIGLARTTIAGAMLAYLADSVSYLASVLSLRFIRTPFQAERALITERNLGKEIAEGLRFLWTQRRLRIMVLLTMGINFLQSSILLDLTVLARGTLHIDVPTLGLIVSAGGVGGLLGGFVGPWLKAHLRFGQVIIGSVLAWTLAALLMALAPSAPLLFLGKALMSVVWPIYSVVLVSYRLSLVPDNLQGRLNSAFRFLSYGIEPLGAAAGGMLLAFIGPRPVFWLITAGLALCTVAVSCTEIRNA